MRDHLRRRIEALLEQRSQLKTDLDAVLAAPTAAGRDLTADEQRTFAEKRDAIRAVDADIDTARGQLADLEEEEKRAAAAAELRATLGTGRPTASAQVTSEPVTYFREGRHSYFLDLARAELGRGDGDGGHSAARDRLKRHAQELEVELPKRLARRDAAAHRALLGIEDGIDDRAAENAFERRVAPNRTDGQGGYFVPPLWMIDQYVDLPRAGRTIANAVRNMPLPGGTDSISLPKVSTGAATGVQTADGAAVTSQDLTDTSVTAPVRTIAGQQDVAMQLLDQSPISFDEVLFADLLADYNSKLDIQVVNGSGLAGQAKGILNTSGINSITYTDASPTLPEMWPAFAQSASQIATKRKLPALAHFMTPAVWYWMISQLDTNGRPLVQIDQAPAFNMAALQTGAVAEGPVGRVVLPNLLDGNIPSNLGAGSNETRIITARTSDLYLWEGTTRTRVLQEVLSGTLQVRFQLWAYFAFMADRRPESVSVISGTGVIPQPGF